MAASDAAAHEGARLREGLLDKSNTSKSVWADSDFRSAINEEFMDRQGFVSLVHRKKPNNCPLAGGETARQKSQVQGARLRGPAPRPLGRVRAFQLCHPDPVLRPFPCEG